MRPRAAPWVGVIGHFGSWWKEEAAQLLVVDAVASIVAIYFTGFAPFGHETTLAGHTSNPVQPAAITILVGAGMPLWFWGASTVSLLIAVVAIGGGFLISCHRSWSAVPVYFGNFRWLQTSVPERNMVHVPGRGQPCRQHRQLDILVRVSLAIR